jgi:serine phosphatase RsbU (regulator of sigma subunit)
VLSFEDEVLGLMAFDSGLEPFLSEALRSQVAASLKLSSLHARVLEETALRERIAHEQLLGEMAIAKRLQTALAPKRLDVPALEIAAAMFPADQVGGDYYDVLPVPGGCWIGFGDVTGHGLLSGLIMLMIQSIVSTLVGTRPNASPAELVTDLNAVLFPNIRDRLGQDEHATLMLLRYAESGALAFAGAHEDVIVYRKATGDCELVPTSGLWLAVRADVRKETRDEQLTLDPGDLLVLYTDGVIEARNSHAEHFGLDRVCRILKDNASDPVERILEEIVGSVRAWFPVQQDDVTCLVARYTGGTR